MEVQKRIILASASPRRKDMFDVLGIDVEVVPSEIAEGGYGGDPKLVPERISLQKVKAVRAREGASFEGVILGADTIVALGHEIFGKPRDRQEAQSMLLKLSKETHQVFTGVVLQDELEERRSFTIQTDVTFREISENEIDWVLNSGEADDKAGGYGIQGKAGAFVEKIKGSYSNVVGLPLSETILALRDLGALL